MRFVAEEYRNLSINVCHDRVQYFVHERNGKRHVLFSWYYGESVYTTTSERKLPWAAVRKILSEALSSKRLLREPARKLNLMFPPRVIEFFKREYDIAPGIGFRKTAGGREAYVLGQRVAVWEVMDVYREAKSISRTAGHFGWPVCLVKCALAYAKQYPEELAAQRKAETEHFTTGAAIDDSFQLPPDLARHLKEG